MLKTILDTLVSFNIYSVIFRIILAAVAGGCIGSERGRHGRAAGLRTHILVCVGAALTTLTGLYVTEVLNLSGDPMRLGAQVISGIGFLGAGTIMTRNQSQIIGLTTAAGLWSTACIGLAIGVGCYWAVAIAFLVVIVTISLLTNLERPIKQAKGNVYYVELASAIHVNDLFELLGGSFSELQVLPPRSGTNGNVGILCTSRSLDSSAEMIDELRKPEYVVFAIPEIR